MQTDWTAWCRRSLAEEDVVRLILDVTVVQVRLDGKATSISLLVARGVRRDGQKVLLAVRNMGGESEAAWRSLLDDLVSRGLPAPGFVMIDGAAGLEKALGLVWPEALVRRCTVHKHRNLLAHAPERLHDVAPQCRRRSATAPTGRRAASTAAAAGTSRAFYRCHRGPRHHNQSSPVRSKRGKLRIVRLIGPNLGGKHLV